MCILEKLVPPEPTANATKTMRDTYLKHKRYAIDDGCLMLSAMCKNLLKDLEHLGIVDLNNRLMEMFQVLARQVRLTR
jgi:hypothetical protein